MFILAHWHKQILPSGKSNEKPVFFAKGAAIPLFKTQSHVSVLDQRAVLQRPEHVVDGVEFTVRDSLERRPTSPIAASSASQAFTAPAQVRATFLSLSKGCVFKKYFYIDSSSFHLFIYNQSGFILHHKHCTLICMIFKR